MKRAPTTPARKAAASPGEHDVREHPGPKAERAALPEPGVPVGLGVDLVDVARFRGVLRRRPALAARLFTEAERADAASGLADPAPRLAARFAAKEAALKALGVGLGAARFVELEVRRLPSGAPELGVSGQAAVLARRAGVGRLLVSLTHTADTAAAVVVALSASPERGMGGPWGEGRGGGQEEG